MVSNFESIHEYGTTDSLDIINGYLEALAHFNTPQSDVGYTFFIQELPFKDLNLETVNKYYELVDTYEVCSKFEVYKNLDEIQKIISQTICHEAFSFLNYISLKSTIDSFPVGMVTQDWRRVNYSDLLTEKILNATQANEILIPTEYSIRATGKWYEIHWKDIFLKNSRATFILHLGFSD